LWSLQKTVFSHKENVDKFSKKSDKKSFVQLVLERDAGLNDVSVYVELVFVSKDNRNFGVARQLFEKVERIVAAEGYPKYSPAQIRAIE